MRPKRFLLLAPMALAACSAPQPAPVPQPRPQPAPPAPVAAPPSAVTRPAAEWVDWPLEQGTWEYRTDARGSIALFGVSGGDAALTLRCDSGRRAIFMSVAGSGDGGNFTIRTSSTLKSYRPATSSATPPYVAIELQPNDMILDAMAFSRGRFAIEVSGLRSFAIPNWGEVSRVIEDCRP
jgi:hypothetical protein